MGLFNERYLTKYRVLLMNHHYKYSPIKNAKRWKGIFFGGCVPSILVIAFIAYSKERAIHARYPNGPPLPKWEFNRHTKDFPWGPDPLFVHLFGKPQYDSKTDD